MIKNEIVNEHAGSTNIDVGLFSFLKKNSDIKSIFDIGCGPGGNVDFCKNLGFQAYGVDGDKNSIPKRNNFKYVDYRFGPSDFNDQFDLAWSIEFAEHIEEKYIENFVKDYLKCKILIFTAAPIGWGGVGHVNEQNQDYWIKKLESYGFKLDIEATNLIRKVSTLEFKNEIRQKRKQFVKNRGLLFINTKF